MKHGSLFSGIGGFDLAAEWMGWDNVFHCEWNEFGQKVLKYYWPNAISYGDITKTDFTIHRGKINILTGGFPCQPYSMAGKRKGKADDRHLWPEMLRAIGEIQPDWIVGENVPGIISWSKGLVFHEVQTDLEAKGYEVFPVVLPACGVNAPHRRDRVWFIAHTVGGRKRELQTVIGREDTPEVGSEDSCGFEKPISTGITSNTDNYGCKRSNSEHEIYSGKRRVNALNDVEQGTTPNSHGLRGGEKYELQQSELSEQYGKGRDATNTGNQGLQGSKVNGSIRKGRSERNEQSSRPFCTKWQDFPTQPPLCGRDDGISTGLDFTSVWGSTNPRRPYITFSKWRNESIKAYGNAIVPQVALQIFKTIAEYAAQRKEITLNIRKFKI